MKCLNKQLPRNHSARDTLSQLQLLTSPDEDFSSQQGVVGWCEGAVYLTSLGRPTDIGLQLGKTCYPCSG